MVLGAGPQQLKLISKARARGAFVLVLDRDQNAPGITLASAYAQCDMLDAEKAIALAKEYQVDAVATGGSDQVMVTVASIAQACGLPCNVSEASAFRATNKAAMTHAFHEWNVPVGRRIFLSENEDTRLLDHFQYPLVIKPVDAQGQVGTTLLHEPNRLPEAIHQALKYSRSRTIAVEEFIRGPEIAAGAWLDRGNLHLLAVTDRPTYNPPPSLGISLQHILPSVAAQNALDEIAEVLTRVAHAYEVTDGPLHAQIVMSPKGPRVMEVGCRFGGANEVDLYKHTLGVDTLEILLDFAFGHPQPFSFDIRRNGFKCHGLINMIIAGEGILTRHESMDRLMQAGKIIDGGWYKKDGFKQGKIIDAYGRIGWFLTTGDSRDEVLKRAAEAYSMLSVLNESGENLILWPDQKYINQCNG